jgi:hypothetical protein
MDEGALVYDPKARAANGQDEGAFEIVFDRFPAACAKMMKQVAHIKATNDRAGAEALVKKYVQSDRVPMATITERVLRVPKASFVYAVRL